MSNAVHQSEHLLLKQRVDDLEVGQGQTLAAATRAEKAAESAERAAKASYEKVALFDGKLNELIRAQRKTARRVESFEDLSEEARAAQLIAENKRLRSMPVKVARWLGWGFGVVAVGLEIAARLGWVK